MVPLVPTDDDDTKYEIQNYAISLMTLVVSLTCFGPRKKTTVAKMVL